MGNSSYDYNARSARAASAGLEKKSVEQIFSKHLHPDLNVKNIVVRECRDSELHPESVPVIIASDVTGSMDFIIEALIKEALPKIMKSLIDHGLGDCAVCMMAVGDHKCDNYPLQVAQFECGDEELDSALSKIYPERGGGGNGGESYMLPWYFAENYVESDAWTKRGVKGFIFTIGDEPCHDSIGSSTLSSIFNRPAEVSETSESIYKKASEKFNIFHINLSSSPRDLKLRFMGENVLHLPAADIRNISDLICTKIKENLVTVTESKADTSVQETVFKDNKNFEDLIQG